MPSPLFKSFHEVKIFSLKPRLSPWEERILEKLAEQVRQIPETEALIVFGSRARAASDEFSDLDVLILLAKGKAEPRLLNRLGRALSTKERMYVNLCLMGRKDFEKSGFFKKNVEREGIVWWRNERFRRAAQDVYDALESACRALLASIGLGFIAPGGSGFDLQTFHRTGKPSGLRGPRSSGPV